MAIDFDDAARVGVIMAHPDDETLWVGGTIRIHPAWRCQVFTLCRAGDADRAPRFARAVQRLGADGHMADLDDGPAQMPLADELIQHTLDVLLSDTTFDLVITHGPHGEYSPVHRRHLETCRAVLMRWQRGQLPARELWLCAYDDAQRTRYPQARPDADVRFTLPTIVWEEKYQLIHEVYGFAQDSWEAQATPRQEAFWRVTTPGDVTKWLPSLEVQ